MLWFWNFLQQFFINEAENYMKDGEENEECVYDKSQDIGERRKRESHLSDS